MRPILTVLAGTMLAFWATETTAIAQVTYYNCPPTVIERPLPIGLMPIGRTQQGDWLDLNPHSLIWTANGVRFNYALNGQTIQGFTTCNGIWTANGRQHRATSPAAKTMLNYVCGDRMSRY